MTVWSSQIRPPSDPLEVERLEQLPRADEHLRRCLGCGRWVASALRCLDCRAWRDDPEYRRGA